MKSLVSFCYVSYYLFLTNTTQLTPQPASSLMQAYNIRTLQLRKKMKTETAFLIE